MRARPCLQKGFAVPDVVSKLLKTIAKRDFVRGVFLLFFAAMMVQLWMFARWALGLSPRQVPRPESVVGIIPIGAFMSFFAWLKTGVWDVVLPAGLVIIIAAIAMSVLLKRGFCGWICPVGAFFQLPADFGKRFRKGRDLPVWRPLDLLLRGLRYLLAAAAVFMLSAVVSTADALSFRALPYYAVADIKIVSYFARPPLIWAGFGAAIIGLSLAYGNVWCRWLCPLGGVYGAIGVASLTNVCRDETLCIACGKCARACPNRVAVDRLQTVRAAECDGCQSCVTACPEPGALTPRIVGRWELGWWAWPVLAVGMWLGIYAVALATGHWHSPLPVDAFRAAWHVISAR